jgi:hypothetical protein
VALAWSSDSEGAPSGVQQAACASALFGEAVIGMGIPYIEPCRCTMPPLIDSCQCTVARR